MFELFNALKFLEFAGISKLRRQSQHSVLYLSHNINDKLICELSSSTPKATCPSLNTRSQIHRVLWDYVNRPVCSSVLLPQTTRDYQYNCFSLAAHEKNKKEIWLMTYFSNSYLSLALLRFFFLFLFLFGKTKLKQKKTLISANKTQRKVSHEFTKKEDKYYTENIVKIYENLLKTS